MQSRKPRKAGQFEKKNQRAGNKSEILEKKFSRVLQTDIPSYTLDKALNVPQMIEDQFARKPVAPLKLAAAMKVQPTSPSFRMLTGASIAYGLTKGGWNAAQIELTPLAVRIVHLTKEGDDLAAKREALLKPRVFGSFLAQYDGHPIPRKDIAINVLKDLGVPGDRAEAALDMMIDGARSVGFITSINGKDYVSLEGVSALAPTPSSDEEAAQQLDEAVSVPVGEPAVPKPSTQGALNPEPHKGASSGQQNQEQTRVFITHGRNTQFVETIKKLITFGKLEPVVAVEKQSVAKPVPDKVMDEMRSCGAAIIHVDAERTIVDKDEKEHVILNSNVLIEIGAAFALYGRRFVLLVREGVQLPSNLQGLYEVRYTGDILDANTTIKLLEAITDIQNNALPNRYGDSRA